MIKLIISILLITSVSFAQSTDEPETSKIQKSAEELFRAQDPALQDSGEMSKVKDLSDCPSCNHSPALIANNHACIVEGICPTSGSGPAEDSKRNKGTND